MDILETSACDARFNGNIILISTVGGYNETHIIAK